MAEKFTRELEKPLMINRLVTHRTPAWKPNLSFGGRCGDMVAIRPCAERFENRTYLGVLLGEFARTVSLWIRGDEIEYDMAMHNPAILIPDINEIVFGIESWWGLISGPEQLRDITDQDIENVWYVRALQQIDRFAKEDEEDDELQYRSTPPLDD